MALQVGTLDRRLVLLLAGGAALCLIVRFGFYGDSGPSVVTATDSIPLAQKRLARLRQLAAAVPGKEDLVARAKAEVADRERGVLKADTEAQADTQLLEIIQATAKANGIDARGVQEFGRQPIGEDYGEIWTTVAFGCGIEQLVNLLAAIGSQPQILATREISVSGGNDKKKNIQVRLTVSAMVQRKLIPKRGATGL